MNALLFAFEIILVITGIALVPARSELRIDRYRQIYNDRKQERIPRS